MKQWPALLNDDPEAQNTLLRFMIKERINDTNDFLNLKNVFMSGRKVARIPTGAADIIDGDRTGDFNTTATYLYVIIENAGTAEWRRTALSTF